MLQLGDTKLFYRSCRSIFNEGKEKLNCTLVGVVSLASYLMV